MSTIMLEEYFVRRENRTRMQELRLKRNEMLRSVKSLKSIKTFQQSYGGLGDTFIEFLEFDSLTGIDEFYKEAYVIPEFAAVVEELRSLIEQGSLSRKMWKQVA